MKKLIYIAIAGAGLTFASSCSKLKEEPLSFYTPDKFYSTSAEAKAGLTAIYGSMASFYSLVGWQLPDYSADQMFPRAVVGRELLTSFNYDPSYGLLNTYWNTLYTGISNANLFLSKVDAVQMPDNLKKQYKAEAHFLRGFFYFHLAKAFGDVPIRTKPALEIADSETPKSSVKDVYKQVFADLELAEPDLPLAPADRGRACKAAAVVILAKARLYNEDWQLAAQKANQLLTAPAAFGLVSNVKDLWNVELEEANRKENIFGIEFSRQPNLTASEFAAYFTVSTPFIKTPYGSQFAYQSFYNSFDNDDARKKLMAISFVNAAGTTINQGTSPLTDSRVAVFKYTDANSNSAAGENNYPVVRYADALLIFAEAEARANGVTPAAYDAINKVRRRAFGFPLDAPSAKDLTPGLSQTAFVEAVLQERSWEFCFEADRWFDLTRTNKFLSVASVVPIEYKTSSRPVQAKHRWFPIPSIEVSTNTKLGGQNPLWQ